MAYTVTKTRTVFGNMNTVFLEITADAATQTIETGLGKIIAHTMSPHSLSTAAIKIYRNSSASGVQAMGSLGISGCVSGDVFTVICHGN